KVQIAIGALALLAAAYLALTRGRPRTPPVWLIRLLEDRSLWVAGVAGLGIALPSLDYLAALAVIAAGAATAGARLTALLMFNVVAFTLVEIPLLAYLVAPERTRAAMTGLHHWIRARRRREVAALLAVVGTVLLGVGLLAA
ncbi:MAG TPA: GAP family protein, partial [Mycobacterium sp.]|nr:GAP family protein [Mycobacterium sp.]HQC77265.1 GAP family protein [Mycobacterium sp.]